MACPILVLPEQFAVVAVGEEEFLPWAEIPNHQIFVVAGEVAPPGIAAAAAAEKEVVHCWVYPIQQRQVAVDSQENFLFHYLACPIQEPGIANWRYHLSATQCQPLRTRAQVCLVLHW